jgi:hypothetical protein
MNICTVNTKKSKEHQINDRFYKLESQQNHEWQNFVGHFFDVFERVAIAPWKEFEKYSNAEQFDDAQCGFVDQFSYVFEVSIWSVLIILIIESFCCIDYQQHIYD